MVGMDGVGFDSGRACEQGRLVCPRLPPPIEDIPRPVHFAVYRQICSSSRYHLPRNICPFWSVRFRPLETVALKSMLGMESLTIRGCNPPL